MESLVYSHLAQGSQSQTQLALEYLHLDKSCLKKPSPFYLLFLTLILSSLGFSNSAIAQSIGQGNRGSQVTAIQQRLQELGYFNHQPTGYFGSITTEAVRQFQRSYGLNPDGIVDQRTQSALFNNFISTTTPLNSPLSTTLPPVSQTLGSLPIPPRIEKGLPVSSIQVTPPVIQTKPSQLSQLRELRPGDRGEDVFELQLRLRQAGFDPGPVNGNYNFPTQRAVEQFQKANNLFSDGVAREDTLQALGLIQTGEANRYVVVVPIYHGDTINQVQRYVSGAFTADSRRGKFVNAGSFQDRNSAEGLSHQLRSQGLDARVAYFR